MAGDVHPQVEEASALAPASEVAVLRRELAERDDLLALLTHELRNPLHVLKLQLELARHSADEGDLSDTRIKIAKAHAQLQRYVKRATLMLDLMGRKNGYPLEVRDVDVRALLNDRAEELRLEAAFRHIALRCELPAVPVIARTDAQALEQIVENLLLNAFKHSNGDSVVLALKASAGGGCIVEIIDNGRGISKEDQARVFRKHEVGQGHDHTHGTGLGLWIVQQLVAILGARLTLRSEAGQGCRFTVALPSMPPSSSSAE